MSEGYPLNALYDWLSNPNYDNGRTIEVYVFERQWVVRCIERDEHKAVGRGVTLLAAIGNLEIPK